MLALILQCFKQPFLLCPCNDVFLLSELSMNAKHSITIELSDGLNPHTFAIKVKHLENGIFIGCLIDTNISNIFQ